MKSKSSKKVILIIIILIIVITFFTLDLHKFLTLDYLKNSNTSIMNYYNANPYTTITIFFIGYLLMAAFSLPGAAIMTIAAGAIFGLLIGTIIVSFASTIGATLNAFFARYLFRDYVEKKYKGKLKIINKGIKKEGVFYLFALRLIPVVPFFVINLVMGLTKMKLKTFYLVSQAGMLLGTAIYVNAGNEIAMIDSMRGILSPSLIFSLVLLGVFPIVIKKLINVYRKKKNG